MKQKPEPLKNKLDFNYYPNRIGFIEYFCKEDIKSAVEYLKQKLKFDNVQNEFVMVKEVYQLIDEAFEDVTK